jgi:uncharacterized protein
VSSGPSGVSSESSLSFEKTRGRKVWIDLDNTPHIPFFRPIIRELEERGMTVVLTARDAYQVCQMAARYSLNPRIIGRHYGRNRMLKLLGFLYRGFQLISFARRERPTLALNHGSRSQTLVCNLLQIPTVTIMDYEHTTELFFAYPKWMIVPHAYPENVKEVPARRVRRYAGLKEDVYAEEFTPDPTIVGSLGLPAGDVIVTVRPPATEAHYHTAKSDQLFESFMKRVCRTPGVTTVLLPRGEAQEQEIRTGHPEWFLGGKVIVPAGIVEGLNLIWHSDLVVSGGGTMNREAAAIGVPVFSIFGGKTAGVDRHLQAQGRLTLISTTQEVEEIPLKKHPREIISKYRPSSALTEIVEHLEEIISVHALAA